MEIRKLSDTDYAVIYALCTRNNYLSELFTSYDIFSSFIELNPSTCFVAIENNTIIGILIASYDGLKCTIYHILIDNEFRRLGYGSKLLHALDNACKEKNCKNITLSTYSTNEVFRKFMKYNSYFSREDLINYSRTIL
ncbi:MAG: GNAT family N-acetyltransferase [Erysipelotrichales bacterium]|nr:GNAT family N-acetyltransferase [Erysipelotrichales bacterium]